MTALPEGFVDPTDAAAVASVLTATAETGGLDAVTDLLARLPGTKVIPAVSKGFLRPGVPLAVWLGAESCWSKTDPPTLLHVVGGIVLGRTVVQVGEVAGVLSPIVVDLARRTGQVADAAAVLTAARDVAH